MIKEKNVKKIFDNTNTKMIFVIILCVQILFMLFYCNMKSGYFVDELWSYGLSNSYYHAQIWEDDALSTTELDPKSFKEYITVNPGEEFSYGSVIYNQTHDSHPPLFYMVLHTVSSFFPGEFNKWFGLIPNIIYYLITNLFLYKIAKLFVKNKYFAFMPMLLYGFSIAAVNSVIYLRMYIMLTMWCMMFAYFHLLTILRKRIRKRDLVLLTIAVLGGMLTHYFFAVFAFPWIVVFVIWLIIRKDWKSFIKYALSGIAGAILVAIIYPAFIGYLLGKQAGHSQTMYANMSNFKDWMNRVVSYFEMVSSEMFGSVFIILLILCAMAVLTYVATHVIWNVKLGYKKDKYYIHVESITERRTWLWDVKREYYLVGITIFSTVFYFMVVSKISPWLSDRYMMAVFPMIVLIFCLLLYWIFKLWKLIPIKRIAAISLCIVLIGGLTYYASDPQYIYPEKAMNVEISEKYGDTSCMYVYSTSYIMVNNALELQNYKKLYHTYYEYLDETIKEVDISNSQLVLYVDRLLDEDPSLSENMTVKQCVEEVMKLTSLNEKEFLFADDKVEVYLLYK